MRAAIYFTPPQNHPLTERAAIWLGRDAFDDRLTRGRDPELDPLVSEPARYGFHATLKAPFRLRSDVPFAGFASPFAALDAAFTAFTAEQSPFELGHLAIERIGRFFALTPLRAPAALGKLEQSVREAFEPFRAPLSEAEIQRRQPDKLTPRQRENLQRWGYPHIGEDFRFHMTLTNSVDEEAYAVERRLNTHFGTVLDQSLQVAGLALFVEPQPGAPFKIHAYRPLGTADQTENRP